MNCQEFWNTIPELCAGESREQEGQVHLAGCPACAARLRRHRELEAGLSAVASGARRVQAPTRVEARLRTAFRREMGHEQAPRRRWIPVATWVAAFAAMFALAMVLVRPRLPEAARPPVQRPVELAMLQPATDSEGFVALPNAAGTAEEDDVNLVRVEVPRSAMIALGYDVSADRAEELVEADVKLGSNGIPRAVRFLD